jgi:hypothetical protein
LPLNKANINEPDIKKKLEASKAALSPSLTLDKIEDKLKRAEEKRKMSLNHTNSPPFEERRQKVIGRKSSFEQRAVEHLQNKVQRDLDLASQNRDKVMAEFKKKI